MGKIMHTCSHYKFLLRKKTGVGQCTVTYSCPVPVAVNTEVARVMNQLQAHCKLTSYQIHAYTHVLPETRLKHQL